MVLRGFLFPIRNGRIAAGQENALLVVVGRSDQSNHSELKALATCSMRMQKDRAPKANQSYESRYIFILIEILRPACYCPHFFFSFPLQSDIPALHDKRTKPCRVRAMKQHSEHACSCRWHQYMQYFSKIFKAMPETSKKSCSLVRWFLGLRIMRIIATLFSLARVIQWTKHIT